MHRTSSTHPIEQAALALLACPRGAVTPLDTAGTDARLGVHSVTHTPEQTQGHESFREISRLGSSSLRASLAPLARGRSAPPPCGWVSFRHVSRLAALFLETFFGLCPRVGSTPRRAEIGLRCTRPRCNQFIFSASRAYTRAPEVPKLHQKCTIFMQNLKKNHKKHKKMHFFYEFIWWILKKVITLRQNLTKTRKSYGKT